MLTHKRNFKKKKNLLSIIIYTFLGIAFLVINFFLINANLRINKEKSEILKQIKTLEDDLKNLEEQKSYYEKKVLSAQSSDFWEEKLREQEYKKKGEDVFVIISPNKELNTTTEPVVKEKTRWQKFLEKIGF